MIRDVTIAEMIEILREIGWDVRDWSEKELEDFKAEVYSSSALGEFEETIKFHFKPEEFRELLIRAGGSREEAIESVRDIFEPQ